MTYFIHILKYVVLQDFMYIIVCHCYRVILSPPVILLTSHRPIVVCLHNYNILHNRVGHA